MLRIKNTAESSGLVLSLEKIHHQTDDELKNFSEISDQWQM